MMTGLCWKQKMITSELASVRDWRGKGYQRIGHEKMKSIPESQFGDIGAPLLRSFKVNSQIAE